MPVVALIIAIPSVFVAEPIVMIIIARTLTRVPDFLHLQEACMGGLLCNN